jgi:protein O-mannosyl-transferase
LLNAMRRALSFTDARPRLGMVLAAAVLVAATLVAYHNSFAVPFIFDDHPSIETNATLDSLAASLSPPTDGRAVTARPLVNLSFAINRALGGQQVRGYHVLNLALHAFSALALFGILRRTLEREVVRDRFAGAELPIAFLAALGWAVHPLQTESVTFVIQRTESLLGFFFLLTLYAFARGADASRHSSAWLTLAVILCAAGMATKEVMVSAPLIVLLYDRTFVAGSFAAAVRARRFFYPALAATWLVLAYLVASQHGARTNVGAYDPATNAWTYLLTQCEAIVRYVGLVLWPQPLVLDYGTDVVRRASEVMPQGLALIVLFLGTLWLLRRAPVFGFCPACFFLILAPSSSLVPLPAQTMAEHRMYLPIACVIVPLIAAAYRVLEYRFLVAAAIVAPALIALTVGRNSDYRTEESIWRDTLAKRPENWRAHYNLGWALAKKQQPGPAAAAFKSALKLKPQHAESHAELGAVLTLLDRIPEAIQHLETAFRMAPHLADTRHNLGYAYLKAGRLAEAASLFESVLQQRDDKLTRLFLAKTYALAARPVEAIREYEAAIQLMPQNAIAHCEVGALLLEQERWPEAERHLTAAAALEPRYADPHVNLGTLFLRTGRAAQAIPHYQDALRLKPEYMHLYSHLGMACAQAGRVAEARQYLEQALRVNPDDTTARQHLAQLAPAPSAAPP